MSDLPTQGLFQQMHARPVSGEHLEVLGKQAAARWSAGQYPTLTEAVTQTVKQAQLSPEQVKRVIEFANTGAFLAEFSKEGSQHRVIEFAGGPADPSAILKDLNDGGGGSVFDRGTLDYDTPPSETKTASAGDDYALEQAFVREDVPMVQANPLGEIVDLQDKLASAADHCGSELISLEVMYADLADRMYGQVKQAALGGLGLGEILQAWEEVMPGPEYVKVAFELMTPRLLREEVFFDVDAMQASVDKTASAKMVNLEHPLVVEFQEFCQVLTKMAELRGAHADIQNCLEQCQAFMKAASLTEMAGKAWGGVTGASKAVGGAAQAAIGGAPGAVVGKAVQYAPHAAGALGAMEVYTHMANSQNPVAKGVRGAAQLVAQNTPGTTQRAQHKWEIQNGQ